MFKETYHFRSERETNSRKLLPLVYYCIAKQLWWLEALESLKIADLYGAYHIAWCPRALSLWSQGKTRSTLHRESFAAVYHDLDGIMLIGQTQFSSLSKANDYLWSLALGRLTRQFWGSKWSHRVLKALKCLWRSRVPSISRSSVNTSLVFYSQRLPLASWLSKEWRLRKMLKLIELQKRAPRHRAPSRKG